MNRTQKLILIIFAAADVVVIGVLCAVVVAQSRRASADDLGRGATISPCAAYMLDSLALSSGSPRVSFPAGGLLAQVTFEQVTDPSEVDPQMLWTLLDSLSPEFEQRCGTPARVTLIADYPSLPTPRQFAASLPGTSLVAWTQGALTDGELAEVAGYRTAGARTP